MCLRFIFNLCAICPAPDWWLCVRHGPVPVSPRCPLAMPPASADFVFPLSPPRCSQADSQVDLVRQHFYEVSLEYVFKVQEVQERKMFEFVEPVSERSALPVPHRGVLGDAVPRSQGSAAPRGVWGRQQGMCFGRAPRCWAQGRELGPMHTQSVWFCRHLCCNGPDCGVCWQLKGEA